MSFQRNLKLLLVTAACLLATTASGTPVAWVGSYSGAGAVVVAQDPSEFLNGGTFVDNGAVTCADADLDGVYETGVGGTCVPFALHAGDSIEVVDTTYGPEIAFQVCIDANGDSVCGGPDGLSCRDLIFFSHESGTRAYHNPLLIPSGAIDHWRNCGSLGFPGFIVITCGGIHDDGVVHTHEVTQGKVFSAVGGTGYGDFCGAPFAAKAYAVH